MARWTETNIDISGCDPAFELDGDEIIRHLNLCNVETVHGETRVTWCRKPISERMDLHAQARMVVSGQSPEFCPICEAELRVIETIVDLADFAPDDGDPR